MQLIPSSSPPSCTPHERCLASQIRRQSGSCQFTLIDWTQSVSCLLRSIFSLLKYTPAEVLQKHPSVGNAGVMHTLDLPYLFNFNSIWELNSIDAATSASIGEDFLTFAREGQVQGWPRFTPQSPSARIYGTRGTTHIEDLSNFRKEECDLWFQLIEAKATPR